MRLKFTLTREEEGTGMLEVLLNEYEMRFGEKFPLEQFADSSEIEVINVLYTCIQDNIRYYKGMKVRNDMFPDAPKRG